MPAVLVVDIDTLFHSQNAFRQGRLHDREPPLGGVCIPPARSFGFEPLRILELGRVQLLDVVEGSELLDILQSWNVGDGELTRERGPMQSRIQGKRWRRLPRRSIGEAALGTARGRVRSFHVVRPCDVLLNPPGRATVIEFEDDLPTFPLLTISIASGKVLQSRRWVTMRSTSMAPESSNACIRSHVDHIFRPLMPLTWRYLNTTSFIGMGMDASPYTLRTFTQPP